MSTACVRCGWEGVEIRTCPDCSTPASREEYFAERAASRAPWICTEGYDNLSNVLAWAESDEWFSFYAYTRYNVTASDAKAFREELEHVARNSFGLEAARRAVCAAYRERLSGEPNLEPAPQIDKATHPDRDEDLQPLRAKVLPRYGIAYPSEVSKPELEPVLEVGDSSESRPGWSKHVDSRFGPDEAGMWRRYGKNLYVSRCGDGSGGLAWGIFDNPNGGCSKGTWKTAEEAMEAAEDREGAHVEVKPTTSYARLSGMVLRWLRERKGLSQKEMARPVSLKHSAWSRIEQGEVSLTVEQLVKICWSLGLNPGSFMEACDTSAEGCLASGIQVSPGRLSDDLSTGFVQVSPKALEEVVSQACHGLKL